MLLSNSSKKYFLTVSLLTSVINAEASEKIDDYFGLSFRELMEIDISGSTRTEQNLLSVPSSVTIFQHEEIKRLGVSSLNELMNHVPGFQSRTSGFSSTVDTITTRGHVSGVAGRDILVLIDGQRINGDWAPGASNRFSLIPLENTEKVEFIRGAGSSLYGSNAFSAVINITTLNNANELAAQISSHSTKGSALLSGKGEEIIYSGFIKGVNDNGESHSGVKDTIGRGQTTAKDPYDSIDLYLQASYKGLSTYFSHNTRDVDDFYSLRRLSENNNRKAEHSHIRVTYDFAPAKKLHSQIALSYLQSSDADFIELAPQAGTFAQAPLFVDADIKEETPSIEWFNSYTLNDKHSFQFGAEYRRTNITKVTVAYNYDIINQPPQIPFYNPDFYTFPLGKESAREIYGVYGQYQGTILDKLNMILGLRYDDYSDFGNSLNPRVALVYEAFDNTSFKFLYSRAFRAPSRNELDLINNDVISGNPELDPETIDNYEMIVVQQYDQHSLSFSYYVNQIDDLIIPVAPTAVGLLRENAESGKYTGLEIEYIGEVTAHFQARASLSHVLSKPDFAFRSSRNIASLILNYNRSNYNLNLSGFYHSSVKNDDAGTLTKIPSYALFNTKLSYHLDKKTSFYFQVKNIFDKESFAPSEGSSLTVDIPNRGRENFAGLEIKF